MCYLYLHQDKKFLLWSRSLTALLGDPRVAKPLHVSSESVSFFLQCGAVLPPRTIYSNIYLLGIGDECAVTECNGCIECVFTNKFPFGTFSGASAKRNYLDPNKLLQLLGDYTVAGLDTRKPTFLFQSAGKDSNSIALALSRRGCARQITALTLKTSGGSDESCIASGLATKMGFHHKTLREVLAPSEEERVTIEAFHEQAPLPCADHVAISYATYAHQVPELVGANIIDGMGNDVFFGHIPGPSEFRKQATATAISFITDLLPSFSTLSLAEVVCRTRAEWTGFHGLSFRDTQKIYPSAINVREYWRGESRKWIDLDYLDLRARLRGTVIDTEVFIRKVRNFSDVYRSILILPWAREAVAQYVSECAEHALFDRGALKNKLPLRNILHECVGLDSDRLGKMVYSFNLLQFVILNREWIVQTVGQCSLWDKQQVNVLLSALFASALGTGRRAQVGGSAIYRIFILSLWHLKTKYTKK